MTSIGRNIDNQTTGLDNLTLLRVLGFHLQSWFGAGAVACALLSVSTVNSAAAATGAPSKPAVVVVPVCSQASRLVLADATVKKSRFEVRATCNDDRRRKTSVSVAGANLPFFVESATPLSIGDPAIASAFDVSNTLGGARRTVAVTRRGGGVCARIDAAPPRPDPSLRRFVSANGDWGASVDYMIDTACTVLIVRLGNRLAVVNPAGSSSVGLYGVHFTVNP